MQIGLLEDLSSTGHVILFPKERCTEDMWNDLAIRSTLIEYQRQQSTQKKFLPSISASLEAGFGCCLPCPPVDITVGRYWIGMMVIPVLEDSWAVKFLIQMGLIYV